MDKENKLILYKDEEGRVSVNTRFADEDVWLTQAQLVEIYQSSKSNISEHIKHIFEYWCPLKLFSAKEMASNRSLYAFVSCLFQK